MNRIILAYVPVLHQGYRLFFEKHALEVNALYLFGRELIQEFDHLIRKDIRALLPEDVKNAIGGWRLFSEIFIADYRMIDIYQTYKPTIIMPDEDECHELAEKYLVNCEIIFDSVFLRWDKSKSLAQKQVNYSRVVSFKGLTADMLSIAAKEAKKATNWWRRVGAVIARDGEILLAAYNRQVPSPRIAYYEGDARSFFKKGLYIELTTDLHAEARLISEAAKKEGISLEGADLYITTFPCPFCAKLVAYSGIKRCYFNSGYAMLDGQRILEDQGVEIIYVK